MTIRRCRQFLARGLMPGVGALMAATLVPDGGSAASQHKLIYSFCATGDGFYCSDGSYPVAGPIEDASGTLYGTTVDGGADGGGTVFELIPNKDKTAWVHKVLYRFCAQGGANCTDGVYPYAGVSRDLSGQLYGATIEGGSVGAGTVFALTPPAAGKTRWGHKVLYSFCQLIDCNDGDYPVAEPIGDASGNLYGTTEDGGTGDDGVVYELSPPATGHTAWTETVLYSFCMLGACADGEAPTARLLRDPLTGNLYGTTRYGGTDNGGVVFELTPPPTGHTWTETVLYSFCAAGGETCTDGERPDARLVRDPSGNLYGTTSEGGVFDEGIVFELTPPSGAKTVWEETVLYSFCAKGGEDCIDGEEPLAGLIRDNSGNLYGTTEYGGAGGAGAVFELMPPASGKAPWKEVVLYSFCGQPGRNCTDGIYPEGGLARDTSGNLYGTTSEGGPYDGGAVFELTK